MGKVIVITGAGDGLGRALARRFASDGDTVILLGRTLAKVQAVADALGAPHVAFECDVGNPASVRAAFATISDRHAKVDVLINNAGIFTPFTLAEVTDDQITEQVNCNLLGPILCARAALPLFIGDGHIINVTTESVVKKMPMLWLYSGTKAGVELMSEMWATEMEADGVRVTVVRAGKMTDETKTGTSWPDGVMARFVAACAKTGVVMSEQAFSQYISVTDAFRAIIDAPPDLHMGLVALNSRKA